MSKNLIGSKAVVRVDPAVEVRAYTAGIIDGEGTVGISASHARGRLHLTPYVSCGTIDDKITPYLFEHWGGYLLMRPAKLPGRPTAVLQWGISGFDNLIFFLAAVRPYLTLKADKADLVTLFCQSRRVNYRKRREERGFTEAEVLLFRQVSKSKIDVKEKQ